MIDNFTTFHDENISFQDIHWEDIHTVRMWCRLPYPGHKNGCPNEMNCRFFYKNLQEKLKSLRLNITWVEFQLDQYCEMMKQKHPDWSQSQLKNLLYWQSHLRKELMVWSQAKHPTGEVIEGAEGGGVNFYKTMEKFKIKLDYPKDLHVIRMIDIVGNQDGLEEFI